MTQTKLDNSNISVHLGKISEYKSQYDASLLVREPRSNNRKHLNINDDDLPFIGNDTWNAYEVSALMDNGMPVAGIAKIVYPCNSKYIVESKSIKLYFNSFNMTKLGADAKQVLENIATHARYDLSELLETDVHVKIFSNHEVASDCCTVYHEYYEKFTTLEEQIGNGIEQVSCYQENPDLLKLVDATPGTKYYHSALLKSNCRVTSQPDWGDVFITYVPDAHDVDEKSLLQYIISFRDECHFHEEICETIYKRLHDALKPKQLNVMCLYARRGGIDINPERSSCEELLHGSLSNVEFFHLKTPKQ
jgi:7-cyano-7-deazaguanine reductase